ncbi:MAG: cupin domain-containing protein [Aeromonadaceae bacterium]
MLKQNLLTDLPVALTEEQVQTLFQGPQVTIERIISHGQSSPWYEQEWDEWVLLVSGAAHLTFADGTLLPLGPGDYLLLPAKTRHRVTWTSPEQETIWLAVHCGIHPQPQP